MMEIPILSDRARIEKWNDICMSQGWSESGELEKWLGVHGILFTPAGSCLGLSLLTVKVEDLQAAEQLVKQGTGEAMATHVLEALTGILVFGGSEAESTFWKAAIERLQLEVDLFMPPEIVPRLARTLLKYPADENQGAV